MGIIYEKLDAKEEALIEEQAENTENGTYRLGYYDLHWSLNLEANTITLTLMNLNGSPVETRLIGKEELEAEFRLSGLYAKISGNFESKQLILNGQLTSIDYRGRRRIRKKYTNVVLTSW